MLFSKSSKMIILLEILLEKRAGIFINYCMKKR